MTIIRNPAAYDKAVQRNIHYNAATTRLKGWKARHEDGERLYNWLHQGGEFVDHCKCGKLLGECTDLGMSDDHVVVAHPLTKAMFYGDFGDFLIQLRDQLFENGSLSDKQTDVVRKALARKEKRVADWDDKLKDIKAREAKSTYVGEVGERREFHLTVDRVHHFDGQWGMTYFNICRDQDDNIVVYRGSNGWWKGDKLVVMATVKDHSDFRGARQTIINRPKVIEEVAHGRSHP